MANNAWIWPRKKRETLTSRIEDEIALLPSYYTDYLKEKHKKVNAIMDDIDHCMAFMLFSDVHIAENRCMSAGMMQSVRKHTAAHDIICAGDVMSSYGTEEDALAWCEEYQEKFGFLHPYFVRGNHDVYNKPSETTVDGYFAPNTLVYNRFFRKHNADVKLEHGKTYYYYDREEVGVRFIAIDTNEIMTYCPHGEQNYFEVSVAISQTQIDWFIDLLKSTPQGYKIVVTGHCPANENLAWYAPFACIFGELIEAFNKKTVIHHVNAEGLCANADFTNTDGKVILYLCGHGHVDDDYISDTGCLYYEINDDSFINNGGSKFLRPLDTVDENAFDVIILDLDREKVHCVRYGGGEDKAFDLRRTK